MKNLFLLYSNKIINYDDIVSISLKIIENNNHIDYKNFLNYQKNNRIVLTDFINDINIESLIYNSKNSSDGILKKISIFSTYSIIKQNKLNNNFKFNDIYNQYVDNIRYLISISETELNFNGEYLFDFVEIDKDLNIQIRPYGSSQIKLIEKINIERNYRNKFLYNIDINLNSILNNIYEFEERVVLRDFHYHDNDVSYNDKKNCYLDIFNNLISVDIDESNFEKYILIFNNSNIDFIQKFIEFINPYINNEFRYPNNKFIVKNVLFDNEIFFLPENLYIIFNVNNISKRNINSDLNNYLTVLRY